jgi:hypothetical protein
MDVKALLGNRKNDIKVMAKLQNKEVATSSASLLYVFDV